MTDLKPNAELAYRVLDQIDAHPETWNQEWWFTVTDCGTAGCYAGWACMLAGDKPAVSIWAAVGEEASHVRLDDGEKVYVRHRAADLLGLDRGRVATLFAADNTRELLGELVEYIFGPRPAVTP